MRRLIAFWLASLILVAVVASGLTVLAQGQTQLLTGNDVGFRVEGTDRRTGNPTGTWVVRLNGEWVEVGSAPTIKRVK